MNTGGQESSEADVTGAETGTELPRFLQATGKVSDWYDRISREVSPVANSAQEFDFALIVQDDTMIAASARNLWGQIVHSKAPIELIEIYAELYENNLAEVLGYDEMNDILTSNKDQ